MDIDTLLRSLNLTENEIKVYKALLKLKKGTKTPIVREAKVLSSKVYEILDRLIEKGLVAFFVENNVKNFVPVPPETISTVFDEKIKQLEQQKKDFQEHLKVLLPAKEYITDIQIFKGWNGLTSAFKLLLNDLKKGDSYYILGANAGEDLEKAIVYFPRIVAMYDKKNIKRKVILRQGARKEAEAYFRKYGKKNWNYRYYPTIGPVEIGITNNYIMLSLLEKEPVITVIRNKKIRDSFLNYFETIWKLAK